MGEGEGERGDEERGGVSEKDRGRREKDKTRVRGREVTFPHE